MSRKFCHTKPLFFTQNRCCAGTKQQKKVTVVATIGAIFVNFRYYLYNTVNIFRFVHKNHLHKRTKAAILSDGGLSCAY